MSAFAVSRFSVAIYYIFIDRSFWREQLAVSQGLIRYRRQKNPSSRRYLLRRNIHRLEKGLSMRHRRPVFALDYIVETVEVYQRCIADSPPTPCDPILDWASDVLCEYFLTVTDHPTVLKARKLFDGFYNSDKGNQKTPVLYREREGAKHGISIDRLSQLSRARRSVRWYTNDRVPRSVIDSALEVASQAPSSCNRQPFRYLFFDEPDQVQVIAKLPRGTAGFAENIPCIAAVIGDLSNFSNSCDRHGIYIDTGLSVMGFLYALETENIGSCILNWPDVEQLERKMEDQLELQKHERLVMLIAIGVPDPEGQIPYSEKSSLDLLRTYNTPADIYKQTLNSDETNEKNASSAQK